MKKCFLVFLLFIGMLSAIAQETSEMQEVMEMHDEVMGKMPSLVKLINKLQTAAQESEDKAIYELAIEDLKTANMSMQDWMVNFGNRFNVDEMMKGKALTPQKKEWLQEEKAAILVVDKKIEESLAKSEKLLDAK